MLDHMAISARFLSCYLEMSKSDIARFFDVCRNTVTEWETRGTVPWSRLKYLSDSMAISWDWLLEGREPTNSDKPAKTPRSKKPKFPRAAINRRFLALFGDMNQTEIASTLGVSSPTVSDWKHNKRQVGWERLEDAVDTFGVTWDWLIDGVGPQSRVK